MLTDPADDRLSKGPSGAQAGTADPVTQGEGKVREAAVELDGVSKHFGEVVAVDALSLTIENGEFFSLLGPSGCGKTTSLRMIAGLEYPSAGVVRIFSEEMGFKPPNRRPVNTVFQSYALFPHMSVAQNVAFGLEMRKVPKDAAGKRVARALELVRLQGMEGRRPKELSGGQQQRVALARALVNEPKVLLLDEPLGALDLKLRQAMQFELKGLQKEIGITFVYVTHDQDEALTMSDRIGVMDQGRLLQVGSPEEIYERPADRFVADFIGDTSFLTGVVSAPGKVELDGGLQVLAAGDSERPGDRVALALRPERVTIHPPGATIEDSLNRASGRVERRIYAGTTIEYEVSLMSSSPPTPGTSLRVRDHTLGGGFQVGDEVVVAWAPEAARILVESR
jgi:spermidine/putrescine transport system ATP-binding protein